MNCPTLTAPLRRGLFVRPAGMNRFSPDAGTPFGDQLAAFAQALLVPPAHVRAVDAGMPSAEKSTVTVDPGSINARMTVVPGVSISVKVMEVSPAASVTVLVADRLPPPDTNDQATPAPLTGLLNASVTLTWSGDP